MYPSANSHQARSRYQALELASRLDGASPHQLVAILYAELLQSLDVAMAALRQDRIDTARRHCDRCQVILIGLGTSLNFDLGGELAPMLAGIYRSMGSELRQVIASQDLGKLQNLRSGVASLAESWGRLV
jgi:flagellar secretion chaperone FliS